MELIQSPRVMYDAMMEDTYNSPQSAIPTIGNYQILMADSWEYIPEEILQITQAEGNDKCVDCGAAKPDWASIGFAVLICLECAGQHRALGVHISLVRSLSMDTWTANYITKMMSGGNKRFKEYLNYLTLLKGIDLSAIPDRYTAPQILYYRFYINATKISTIISPSIS
jgi:hypothetical protein